MTQGPRMYLTGLKPIKKLQESDETQTGSGGKAMRLAEPIEIEGTFWLEDVDSDEDKGISGQLTIDTDGRTRLRLHDVNQLYLEDITKRFFQRFSGTVSPYDWITGVGSEGQLIWLHRAVTTGGLSFGGPKVHSFLVSYVFIGKQLGGSGFPLERLDHLAFTRLICEIEGVWEWLGVSGFRYPLEIHQWFLEGCKEPLKVQYERPSNDSLQSEEPWVWHADRPGMTLAFRVAPTTYTAPFNRRIYPEFTLKETTTIEIKPATRTFNLDDVTEHMRILRNFFALVMDAPVDVRQCEVHVANPWGQGKDPIDLSLYCYTGKLKGNAYEPGHVKTVLLGNCSAARANGSRWPMLRGWYQVYAEHEYAIRVLGGPLQRCAAIQSVYVFVPQSGSVDAESQMHCAKVALPALTNYGQGSKQDILGKEAEGNSQSLGAWGQKGEYPPGV